MTREEKLKALITAQLYLGALKQKKEREKLLSMDTAALSDAEQTIRKQAQAYGFAVGEIGLHAYANLTVTLLGEEEKNAEQ